MVIQANQNFHTTGKKESFTAKTYASLNTTSSEMNQKSETKASLKTPGLLAKEFILV